jgi:hypothetical protein
MASPSASESLGRRLLADLPGEQLACLRSLCTSAGDDSSAALVDRQLREFGVKKLGHRLAIGLVLRSGTGEEVEVPSTSSPSPAACDPVLPESSIDHSAAAPRLPQTTTKVAAARWYRVVNKFVYVREERNTSSRILALQYSGDAFEVAREAEGWVCPTELYGSYEGWILVDGVGLGLGALLERVSASDAAKLQAAADAAAPASVQRHLNLLSRPPKAASVNGPLTPLVAAPVRRWRVSRPAVLVHAQPRRSSAVVDICLQSDIVWSGTVVRAAGAAGAAGAALSERQCHGGDDWHRMADPDGWVHTRCPAGYPQLEEEGERHSGFPERELEALDLFIQARVAVEQTYGSGSRLKLPKLFLGWEDEALQLAAASERAPQEWEAVRKQRALVQQSPFAQMLLSACHRDVVLTAQHTAKSTALRPEDCRRERLPGEKPLSLDDVQMLQSSEMIVLDDVLPADIIERCCAEAEALDAAGHLQPPAMHRALGDRRDRLVGLNEDTAYALITY